MTEKQGRDRENPRREAEMYRVEAIQAEMSSAVRVLGGDGPAKEQNNRAARAARLPVTTIERLRWRKITCGGRLQAAGAMLIFRTERGEP